MRVQLHFPMLPHQLQPKLSHSHHFNLPPSPTRTQKNVVGMDQRGNVTARTSEDSTILTIPIELLVDIVRRLGLQSMQDVFSLRLSCKTFDAVGKDPCVLANMAIEYPDEWGMSLAVGSRKDIHARRFLDLCVHAGNPEAIFQRGMVNYFTNCDYEAAFRDLLQASELGHDVATYVCGIAMFSCGCEDLKPNGFALLNSVKKKLGYKIVSCRRRVADVCYSIIETRRTPVIKWKPNTCTNITNGTAIQSCRRSNFWMNRQLLLEDEDDARSCEECTCTIECGFVHGLLQWITRHLVG